VAAVNFACDNNLRLVVKGGGHSREGTHAYNAVVTGGGRYVQGGGCATVGVAGLIQSSGFGKQPDRTRPDGERRLRRVRSSQRIGNGTSPMRS
jgi:hypothetical protein